MKQSETCKGVWILSIPTVNGDIAQIRILHIFTDSNSNVSHIAHDKRAEQVLGFCLHIS